MLNFISNKVVAKIYTDLQVFTTYQYVFAALLVLARSRMATQSNARSVLTLNPELNARCAIILICIENLLPPAPLHFIVTIKPNIWNEEGEEEKQAAIVA